MSTFTHESMINHHGHSLFLNQLAGPYTMGGSATSSARPGSPLVGPGAADIGLSSSDAIYEASKTVLAGIKGSQAGVTLPGDAGPLPFASDRSVR
jgi:hypothetical protein